jgi:hypothetical protein
LCVCARYRLWFCFDGSGEMKTNVVLKAPSSPCIHGSSQSAPTRARRRGSLTSNHAMTSRTAARRISCTPRGSPCTRSSTVGAGQVHSPRTTRRTHRLRARSASRSVVGVSSRSGGSKGSTRVTSANRTTPSDHASVSQPSYVPGVRARGCFACGVCCAKWVEPRASDGAREREGRGGSSSAVLCAATSSSGAAWDSEPQRVQSHGSSGSILRARPKSVNFTRGLPSGGREVKGLAVRRMSVRRVRCH